MPGFAAPSRDMAEMDVTVDDGLEALLEITARAYLGPRWAAVLDGRLPDPESDSALAWRPWNAVAFVLAMDGEDEMTLEDAKSLIAEIFTDPPRTEAGDPGELLTLKDGRITLNRENLESEFTLLVYPYSATFDGDEAHVKADLYCTPAEDTGRAEDMPEDMVIWLMHMEYDLAYSPQTHFGYTVNECSVSPAYRDGDLTAWYLAENTEYEYSLNIPSSFGLAEEDAMNRAWQTADGSATLTVRIREGGMSLEEAKNAFVKAHPESEIDVQGNDFFYLFEEGCFTLVVASENANWTYTLTMTFPKERQAEYELYAEFIRNSFVVWGLSNG